MASPTKRDRKRKRPAVPDDSPNFCLRIFTLDDTKDGKKELLETVVRTYRDRVADHIFLTVPKCEQPWKIQLRKSPRHERMWLEKGWEEFANFYKLDQGDFATFIYEGKHSHFQVRIYSSTDLEIDYPIRGGGSDSIRPKRKETGAVIAISSPSGSSADEHDYDLSWVSSFRSDKPFLNIRIPAKALAFRVFINQSFASEHFYKAGTSCDLTLQNILGDKIWTIQCCSYKRSNGRIQAIISGAGWKAFRQDNHLEEGDVCVLELIEELKCRVSIFRAKK
ncbi:hypothetical protein M0R45_038326 [Rubus argutus]|uniref:TF-B3 domain-containing protein n=1 Tax=Rubus argutus TaxID=59490 RepID=A0AAW1W4W3_RUBAR